MDRFIATAIRLVRIEPDAPTIMPATIIAVLFSAKPAAAADNPVIAFSREMTTGISAPPMGNTTNNPIRPANTSTSTIHHCALPSPGWARRPMYTAAPMAAISRTMLDAWNSLALDTSFFSTFFGIDSCNFAKATSEPQNDTEPMIAANSDPTTSATVGACSGLNSEKPLVSMNSAQAISATVPPPTPLKRATNCGIAVILVFLAGGTPRITPSARPATIRTQLIAAVSRTLISVASTAIPMPAAAIQLPRTAVFGPVSPDNPRMKSPKATM